MKTLINNEWVNDEAAIDGELYLSTNGSKAKNGEYAGHTAIYSSTPIAEPAIRNISTGAMQRRFTIPEEVFIASDAAATVIKSRLLNASFCNLDFQDTIEGVTYICGILKAGAVITDDAARIVELLADGTQDEAI